MSDPFNVVPVLPSWVEQVLAREHDDVRFEAFANDVVSVLEGKPILATSKSWDLGRDGRGVGSRQGTYVLTTLRSDSDKPRDDATRLKATAWKLRHVYYVAPRLVSEKVLEEHSEVIRSILGNEVPIDSIGGTQLSDLVASGKAAKAFAKHYAGELASIKSALAADTDEPESKHLELALSTFAATNTQELRVALSTRLILGLLRTGPLTPGELSAAAAIRLGVAAFSDSSIAHYCGLLLQRGHLFQDGQRYQVSQSGLDALSAGDQDVVATQLTGRDAVRNAVEESLGSSIPDPQWNLIWGALQKALAHAFYVRGKQVLDVISTLLQGDTSTVQRDVLGVLVDEVLTGVIGTYVSAPGRATMLRALRDAFLPGDKHGAFEWLAGVAGRFAATCTLGLPHEIGSTLTETLKKIRCFVDTDVVVSYLCAHEPSHAAAHAVVRLHRRLGNQVMITEAVAEEAARHAMKAYTDYRIRVAPITGVLEWYEIAELESAFTREFEHLRKAGKVTTKQWPAFIARYAGDEAKSYGKQQRPNTAKMRSLLSSEGFAIRSPGDQTLHWEQQRDALAKLMFAEAMRGRPSGRPDIVEHKARIDAEMLIAVSRTIVDSQARGSGERYILITSARRLRTLPSGVKAQLPDVPEVLSLAEAATIASLLPENAVSLAALHTLLFEGHFTQTVGRLEAKLLRIVREASSAVLPGATRGLLCEEFGTAILREARATGESKSEVRNRIDSDAVGLAKIAAAAVDALALSRPLDREEAMRRIEEVIASKRQGSSES